MENNQLATAQGFAMFQRPSKTGVKLYGDPVKIKCNCAGKGQFTDAQDTYIGNTMEMVVVNTKEAHGSLFNYDPQYWREILFVNKDNAVCITLIKGESLTQFKNCIQSILLKGISVAEAVITAKFSPRTNKAGQSYSVVEFAWTETPKEKFEMVVEFVSKNPQIMGYSYLDELMTRTAHIDTETGEEIQDAEIIEHDNMATTEAPYQNQK